MDRRPFESVIFAAARDITEQKRLRQQLEQRNRELEIQNQRVEEANRLKSEFLANMSHELRTPLNSIIGFSEFLLTQENRHFKPEQLEYLDDILTSGHHLLQLINDILDLAKVEAGKHGALPVRGSRPSGRWPRSAKSFARRSSRRGSSSRLRPSRPRSTTSVLDPLRFKQILFNLVSNAVKFTDPRGKRSISRSGPRDPSRSRCASRTRASASP